MRETAVETQSWKVAILAGLCWVMLQSTGCTFVLTDFSILSTRSENATLQLGARVQGESCSYLLFGAIPVAGDNQATLKQAIDRALDQGQAKFLIDGIASDETTGVPPLFHVHCYRVEGTTANPPLP